MKRCGLVLVVLLVLAAPAHAALRAGVRVSGAGISRPAVGVAADGSAVVAWIDFQGRVAVSVRPASGRFGRPRELPGSADAREVTMAVDANGRTVVAWRRGRGSGSSIRYAAGNAGDAVGHTRTVPGSGSAIDVHVGIDDSRLVVFLWSAQARGGRRVVRARIGARAMTVAGCCRGPSHLALSVGADGTAIAGWLSRHGAGHVVEAAVKGPRGRRFAKPRQLRAPLGAANVAPAVAAGARGAVAAAWRTSGGHDRNGARGVVVATIGGTSGLPAATAVSTATRIAGAPAVALSAGGRAIAVWLEGPVGRYTAAAAVHENGTAGFAPPETLGPGAYDVSRTDPQVGMADDGRALAAWGFPGPRNYGLLAAGHPAAGGWTPPRQLSGGEYATRVAVDVAYSGRAVAAWVEDRPPHDAGIYAATGSAG